MYGLEEKGTKTGRGGGGEDRTVYAYELVEKSTKSNRGGGGKDGLVGNWKYPITIISVLSFVSRCSH